MHFFMLHQGYFIMRKKVEGIHDNARYFEWNLDLQTHDIFLLVQCSNSRSALCVQKQIRSHDFF